MIRKILLERSEKIILCFINCLKRYLERKLYLNKSRNGYSSNYSAILAYIISLLVAKYLGVQVDKTRDG